MKHEMETMKTELKVLCIKMISSLNDLKRKGLITEEEYQKHIILKRAFLQDELESIMERVL